MAIYGLPNLFMEAMVFLILIQVSFENYAAANNLSILHSAYLINLKDYEQFMVPANKSLLDVLLI